MALGARLRDALGLEVQSIWSDDGIALHLPEADVLPPIADLLLTPDEIEELVVAGGGEHRAVRRALPRERRPGAPDPAPPAGPAHAAVAAAPEGPEPAPGRAQLRLVPDRARDLPRVPAGRLRPAGAEAHPARASRPASSISSRSRRPRPRRSPRRSSSPTSPPTCTRTTRPPPSAARRRSRSTATSSASCSARRSCATCSTRRRWPRSRRSSPAIRVRPTSSTICSGAAAISATTRSTRHTRRCSRQSGARLRVRVAGEERLIAVEDAGLFRDALGVMPPGGLPEAYLDAVPDALGVLLGRFARSRGPFTTAEAAARYELEPAAVEAVLLGLERADKLVRGELRPGGVEREWCDPDVLRRLRRASLAALRKEVEPAEQAALGRFLPAWHGIDRRAEPARGARSAAGACRCRCRSGRARCCAAACRTTSPPGSTRSAPPARWSGSGRGSTASRSTSDPMRRCSARRPARPLPRARRRRRCAPPSPGRPSSGPTCSRRRGSTPRRRCRRSGSSSGPVR